MESGDIIVRYEGERILTLADLQTATAAGDPRDTAAIEVLRDDHPLRVYLPFGPLGVQVKATRKEPTETR